MAEHSRNSGRKSKMNVDIELLRELAELLSETGLSEIEVEDGDRKLRVARELHAASYTAAPAPQAAAAVNPAGEKLYKSVCFACHATGVANAPKFGDKAAWDPYIKTGMDAMVKVAMQGKPPMPPKGGAADASEDDIRAAVQYMVDAAK